MSTTEAQVKELALELGFDLVGIASSEAFADHQSVTLERVDAGLMEGLPWYTEAWVRRGCSPEELLPGARSIITVGMSYYAEESNMVDSATKGKVARYAWGDDYHQVMKGKLRTLAEALSQRLDSRAESRWYVDDGPMLDRAAAARGGIGWFGKNTNILTRSHGSWVFLGQLITNLDLLPDAPLKKTCGSCVRCIDVCPTGAIIAPYVLDNTRCISYLTIENRGPIPREMRPLVGNWVFGCDLCQDVCPVNFKAAPAKEKAFTGVRFETLELVKLLDLTEDEFREQFRNSPIKRAKRAGLQRNACVALGNAGDPRAVPALTKAMKAGEVLVRSHAAWALGRIGGEDATQHLGAAALTEDDPEVLEEIMAALSVVEDEARFLPPVKS